MINIDKAIIARYKVGKDNFEILVDCNKALEFKEGKKVNIIDVLATNMIYKDVKKGLFASEHEIQNVFGTDDPLKVAEEIIKKGIIHETAEHKNKKRDEIKKQLIQLIHRNAIDPKTNTPHPVKRIEIALEDAKVKIDENKTAEDQVKDIITKINAIIPIKFETRRLQIRIPGKYGGQAFHILKKYCVIEKDQWDTDGYLNVMVVLPAGMQEEFFDELNNLTHGSIESKIM